MSVKSVLGEKLPFSGSIKCLGCQCSFVCLLSSTNCVTFRVCNRKRIGLVLSSLRSNSIIIILFYFLRFILLGLSEEGISIPVAVVTSNHELWSLGTISLAHTH